MKIRYCFYAVVAFLVGVSLACLVSYATDRIHNDPPKQQAPVEMTSAVPTTVSIEKKKNCGCCAERRERIEKMKRQARERRLAKQQVLNGNPP
ncbi:MAG: hypothetical protein OXN27_04240 [Candidatus Poribacteria bacterium]|nr:hypothetical protein [Candidatus Poribacteria bacterium]